MPSLVNILLKTADYFKEQGIPSPRLETERLFAHFFKMTRIELYTKFDLPVQESEIVELRKMVARRGNREPMAWITGECGFYEHDFIVQKGVLCPRSDTETLVDSVLKLIPEDGEYFIADIGCGSGCIGLSLVLARPNTKLYAVDISPEALNCTKANVARFSLENRVAVLNGPFLTPIPSERQIDIIVSNPPYIPSEDIWDCEPEVSQHEPRIALDGGPDGLTAYSMLIPKAAERANIAVAVEVGIHQAVPVANIMRDSNLKNIIIYKDLGGVERVVIGFCN
jgi:release factor glutamine methyltransferase